MRSIAEIFRSHDEVDTDGRHVGGTDKNGPNHQYGDAYERIIEGTFSPSRMTGTEGSALAARAAVSLMMEVGVADGSCLLAWREVFPNATVVGVDIHPSARAQGDRIEFYLGDQRNQRDCEAAAAGRQFDLIVEDATHHLPNTLLTFLYLWPFVRPGGLYVVEEWDCIGGMYHNVRAMWPNAEIVDTVGPSGGNEPLVVFRKPVWSNV